MTKPVIATCENIIQEVNDKITLYHSVVEVKKIVGLSFSNLSSKFKLQYCVLGMYKLYAHAVLHCCPKM